MTRSSSVALISVVLVAGVLAGCGGGGASDTTTSAADVVSTPASDVEMIDLRTAGATQAALDGDWLLGTDDAIWLFAGTKLDRIDPETGEQRGAVDVPGGPCLGGVYAFGAVYTATCYADKGMVRIDPDRMQVTKTVSLPTPSLYNEEATIAAGAGAIWVVIDGKNCEACVLAGLDAKTLSTTHEIDLDPGAASVAFGGGIVWVSDPKRNRILRIDPSTDEIVGETEVGGLPQYLAIDSNGVWVLNRLEGTVTQLDPDTGELIRTIEADMAGAGGSITVGEGSVWVRGTLTLLKQIDPETGEIVAQFGPDQGSGDALARDGILWISAFKPGHGIGPGSGVVYRLPLSTNGDS